MLLVDTYLEKSPIQGIGVFAKAAIPKGTLDLANSTSASTG